MVFASPLWLLGLIPWLAAVIFPWGLVNGGAQVTVFQADFEASSIAANTDVANLESGTATREQ